jgi:hypothetical protein
MQIIPWQRVGPLKFGDRPSAVEAAIGLAVETRNADAWTICDYGEQEIATTSLYNGRLASLLVVPMSGTMLSNRGIERISQANTENLLLANGHEFIHKPRVHTVLRDAIEAPTAGLDFKFTDDCCDAIGIQAAILANLRHMREYYQESNASKSIIKSLDNMLVAIKNA